MNSLEAFAMLVPTTQNPGLAFSQSAFGTRTPQPFHPFIAKEFGADPAFAQPPVDAVVSKASKTFYKATLGKSFGSDTQTVQDILKHVHQQGVKQPFQLSVLQLARQDGYAVNSLEEILDRKFSGPLAFVRQVPRKECMDLWTHGQNLYRPSAMEYRVRGMWTAITDFLTVCQKHPVLSTAVIGSVAYFGGTYPFLGAVSGIGIMAWSSVVVLINELKARQIPNMNAQKAEHYQQSGENTMAFLLTASGADGIYAGAKNGLKVFQNAKSAKEHASWVRNMGVKIWHAVKSRLAHGEEVGLRFVVGLFDNVLLPFNALADKMGSQKQ